MSTNTALDQIKARVEGHTEGPWDVTGMDSGHSRYEMDWWVTAGDGDTICDMDGLARSRNERVALNDGRADAELIAAAPKLLAALEAVESRVGETASAYRKTADRLNQQVIDLDPDRDVATAAMYSSYARAWESANEAIHRAIEEALR